MARTHAVVIPTALHDPAALRRVVAAVHAQSLPVQQVVVVSCGRPPELDATVVVTPRPGTATQRNAGLEAVAADIVHFVDDDVLVEPDYVASIDAAYDLSGVVGATGNLARVVRTQVVGPRLRQLLQGRPGPGCVSRAGVAEPIDPTHGDYDVQWMPAAAMSFDRAAADGLRFDETLERGPTGPYALHEDVDLTHRLSHRGRLRFVSTARAEHIGADTWRLDWPAYWEMRTLTRRYLATKPDLALSRTRARLHLAVDLVLASYLVLTGRSRPACVAGAARGIVGPGLDRRDAPR